MLIDNLLVSICVITYNSSEFVLETLESIKLQTYKPIELIISDDYSSDNTLALCQEWIELNKKHFFRVKLLEASKNTGISANCNRAYNETKGEWIKFIAGDDILIKNCIKLNIDYISKNKDTDVVFSTFEFFGGTNEQKMKINTQFDYSVFNLTASDQYYRLLRGNCIPAPTAFFSRKILSKQQFDERIPLIEDYPYWLSITKKGVKLSFFDNSTVLYRLHLNSLSSVMKKEYKFIESECLCYFLYIFSSTILIYPKKALINLFRFSLIYLKNKFDLFTN